MPVYEYVCKECGNHTEVAQSFKDDPLTTCPVCGGPLRKVFNSIGIVLKGSGFYRTDSRMPTKAGKKDKEKAGESKSTEPAAKTDTKASTSESSSSSNSSSSSSSITTSDSKSTKSA